ncbi:hypothetical protein ACOSQ2_010111 [Xanthoceras sorbifolium]
MKDLLGDHEWEASIPSIMRRRLSRVGGKEPPFAAPFLSLRLIRVVAQVGVQEMPTTNTDYIVDVQTCRIDLGLMIRYEKGAVMAAGAICLAAHCSPKSQRLQL